MTHLGSRLRATRERLGFTQAALAQKVGVDRSHISKIESGETSGSIQLITRIAAALGIRVSDLLDDNPDATGTDG